MIKLIKHFLLPVTVNAAEPGMCSPNFFLLSLSAKDVERYHRWRSVIQLCKDALKEGSQRDDHAAVPEFAGLLLIDFQQCFFDTRLPGLCDNDRTRVANILGRLTSDYMELSGDEAFFLDTLVEADRAGYQPMIYVHANINEDGILWSGAPRGCDYDIETARVAWRDLYEKPISEPILTR